MRLLYIIITTGCLWLPLHLTADSGHVEPANWWVGMKDTSLQVLINEPDIASATPELHYKGVLIDRMVRTENPNYVFLYLHIEPQTKAGSFDIIFTKDGSEVKRIPYSLLQRSQSAESYKGFDQSDCMYLVQPDRFANGDPTNDSISDCLQTGTDRSEPYARHGGDIRGMISNLDYLQNMGFTALWPNPLLENDQPEQSYHGYAITDFYKVDPRYGTLDDYKELCSEAHKRGIKVIMDVIFNHCGSEHWWMKDLPTEDWVNYPETHTITNHRRSTNLDPHAAKADAERMTKGWFVDSMPDMNTDNPLMADYLIQNTIWWVETLNLGGIRVDTYPYPGKTFMARWCQRILQEYPNMNMVGEEWTNNPIIVSYWQQDKKNPDGYQGHLPSLFDFPMQLSMAPALNEPEGFDTGFVKLYEMLANDFIYAHPEDLVIFLGNHDCSRYLPAINNNVGLAKNAMAWLFTMRGTPQFYYGDEILMAHAKDGGHGEIRGDFPGGFEGDTKDGFTGIGLSHEEADFQSFVRTLAQWRKTTPVVQTGKLTHFAPEDGVYVYFRYNSDQCVMVVLNKNEKPYELNLKRFDSFLSPHKAAYSVIDDVTVPLQESIVLTPQKPLILELK